MLTLTCKFSRTTRILILIAGVLAALNSARAADTVIRDVTVFDGETAHAHRSVWLRQGKIADANFKGATPVGAREVQCRDCTLLPGLIDSHVHAFANRELTLAAGVTTEMDMFMEPGQMRTIKAKLRAGSLPDQADLFSAGILATAPGGHGTEYGFAIPTITKADEAEDFVKARIAEGSDYIKIVYDDGHQYHFNFPTLDKPVLHALVQAAHRHHKLAVVHIGTLAQARDAVEAGADGLVHLFADKVADPEFVALARKSGVFVVPTWTVMEGFAGRSAAQSLLQSPQLEAVLDSAQLSILRQQSGKDHVAELDQTMQGNISALKAAGVPILAGTDAGNPGTLPGVSLHRELELLVQAGLSPAQALHAATAAPAQVFHLKDRGRIRNGMKADLLLVNGDPTRDIRATRAVVEVWKDGNSKAGLRESRVAAVAEARAKAAAKTVVALPAEGKMLDFDGAGHPHAPFGHGWAINTDTIMGGHSVAELSGEGQALVIRGEVKDGAPMKWGGAMFYPGKAPFAPQDLGAADAIRFKVRGDGKRYTLLMYSQARGYTPAFTSFETAGEWQEQVIPFSRLGGFEPRDATAIGFVSFGEPGAFRMEIKDVELIHQGG